MLTASGFFDMEILLFKPWACQTTPALREPVTVTVVVDKHRELRFGYGDHFFFQNDKRDMGINLLHGKKKSPRQHHLPAVRLLRRFTIMGDIQAKGVFITALTEPLQTELVFVNHQSPPSNRLCVNRHGAIYY